MSKKAAPLVDLNQKQTRSKKTTIDWSQKIDSSVEYLPPSGIRAFFDIVSERSDCISLGVGEPDFVSPEPVLDSAITAIRQGFTHYTGNQGMPSLREKITRYLFSEYGLSYDPESEVLITVGVSQGLDLALRSIVTEGDEVIFPSPSYVSYSPLIKMNGGIPRKASLSFTDAFRLSAPIISQQLSEASKVLLLNYPSNPTGASMNENDLKEISELVIRNNLLVISDEIYGELTYESKHIPIASLPGMKERSLLLGGFSKVFAMTGFRVGYACGPKEWIHAMLKIHQYSMLCAPTVSQIAAEAALEQAISHRDQMIDKYNRRRYELMASLDQIGLKCHKPQGAFYIFPSIEKTGLRSMDFATKLLDKEGVAVVPGTAFGEEGEGFIRCSYAASIKDIREAVERMKRFVNSC